MWDKHFSWLSFQTNIHKKKKQTRWEWRFSQVKQELIHNRTDINKPQFHIHQSSPAPQPSPSPFPLTIHTIHPHLRATGARQGRLAVHLQHADGVAQGIRHHRGGESNEGVPQVLAVTGRTWGPRCGKWGMAIPVRKGGDGLVEVEVGWTCWKGHLVEFLMWRVEQWTCNYRTIKI